MTQSYQFLNQVLDSVTEHIVVIDEQGTIVFCNQSWTRFGNDNACVISSWQGINYLEECDLAAARKDAFGGPAGAGIRSVIRGERELFYFEYPCHSPQEQRWFMMRATPFQHDSQRFFVISHQNITDRKLAENRVLDLARIDGLTDIANRRYFDECLAIEWRRCLRLGKPLALALIDIDHFKLLNDTYGHQAGDDCLVQLASTLKDFARRTGDLCARYGGEEFAMIWSDTSLQEARQLANEVLRAVADLDIPNEQAPDHRGLTASIGVVSLVPGADGNEQDLIEACDKRLYKAKQSGRNRVV